ncbi:hypothetical protein ACFFMN_18610 [Planobispora siamensis]|uniref:Uncharacterized protein n=1 Tax=Planobispora siamensis TaxID=936338 RepID=A0A8J3WNG6_9ACTN|nr:hypothetical protein [Planobispora siamensis]GIH94442.1 hypothetical protein Psi01_50720 [Planobispora siamensis]
MSETERKRSASGWTLTRELLNVGAIIVAAGIAHLVMGLIGHGKYGPVMLLALGGVLVAAALGHRFYEERRHRREQVVECVRCAEAVPPELVSGTARRAP